MVFDSLFDCFAIITGGTERNEFYGCNYVCPHSEPLKCNIMLKINRDIVSTCDYCLETYLDYATKYDCERFNVKTSFGVATVSGLYAPGEPWQVTCRPRRLPF